ncbi:MAG: hypothetical protein GXP56_17910 [Deltaproteobacteria bacterium]|nr:hypothetical protein [Deltaproteobacteria bacterium]
MKSGKIFFYLFLSLFFFLSACKDEKGKGDYSGVSELIANRNKARYDLAENPPAKSVKLKKRAKASNALKPESNSKKKENFSSVILYSEDVKIIGSESGQTLAKAVAYINKSGQIVKIKILKE